MSKRTRWLLLTVAISMVELALTLRDGSAAIIMENLNDSRGLNYGVVNAIAYLLGAY